MTRKRRLANQNGLDSMRDKFQSGHVLSTDDFKSAGLSNIPYALIVLRDAYKLDILSIRRGTTMIGWALADEIL